MTATLQERARLDALKIELNALYYELRNRPATAVETKISDTAAELIDVPGLPRFPFEALIMFRMTDADKQRETRILSEWNEIARAVNERIKSRRQAKINAREISKIRAAACPVCFATHAGECA